MKKIGSFFCLVFFLTTRFFAQEFYPQYEFDDDAFCPPNNAAYYPGETMTPYHSENGLAPYHPLNGSYPSPDSQSYPGELPPGNRPPANGRSKPPISNTKGTYQSHLPSQAHAPPEPPYPNPDDPCEPQGCPRACPQPGCYPSAPLCGTYCGVTACAIAFAVAAVVGVAILIVVVSPDSSTVHQANL